MSAQVRIPTPLRKLTNNEEIVDVKTGSIADSFADLQARFPGIKERLLDDTGAVRRFVNVYVNEEDIRFLGGNNYQFREGDRVLVVPSIAGPQSPRVSGSGRRACRDRRRVNPRIRSTSNDQDRRRVGVSPSPAPVSRA